MVKYKSRNLTGALTVLIALLSVFISSFGAINAWFTDLNKDGVYVIFNIGEINLKLYQITIEDEDNKIYTEVYSNNKNNIKNTTKFINLGKEILPDEVNELSIAISNEDAGGDVEFRFKFEVFACGLTDKLLDSNLTTCDNIVLEEDGYYYYKDGENNILLENNATKVNLFTDFTIPYSSYVGLYGGETIKLVLTIEVI